MRWPLANRKPPSPSPPTLNSTYWPCCGGWERRRCAKFTTNLGKDNGYTTTLKQMQLMTEKGWWRAANASARTSMKAGVPKEQTQTQIAGDLLKRAFDGSAGSLVLGALSAQPASREELAEIRGMLDTFVKQKGRSR